MSAEQEEARRQLEITLAALVAAYEQKFKFKVTAAKVWRSEAPMFEPSKLMVDLEAE